MAVIFVYIIRLFRLTISNSIRGGDRVLTLKDLQRYARKQSASLLSDDAREQFYKSKAWTIKAAQIKRRDNWECQLCKASGGVTIKDKHNILITHHIKPLEYYPEYKLIDSNLITLCGTCHNMVHYVSNHKLKWDDERW